MLIAEELKLERQKRLIKDHKKRMFNMRFMGLDWQEIHQKRWDEDTCDCEEIYNNERMRNEKEN